MPFFNHIGNIFEGVKSNIVKEFFQVYEAIVVNIIMIECSIKSTKTDLMIRFHLFKIFIKLRPCNYLIVILIVSEFEKLAYIMLTEPGRASI